VSQTGRLVALRAGAGLQVLRRQDAHRVRVRDQRRRGPEWIGARATSPTPCAGRSASRAARSGRGAPRTSLFAGSERRSALGMADVSLVLDNADGLIPLDFGQLELGRRLYRSGENDYLVNRQRVSPARPGRPARRGHLAENAFLFIGQGMVDQAPGPAARRAPAALRGSGRRAAARTAAPTGRGASSKRAGANLARVDDVLGELRPQARRLATQAEQHATRARAGRSWRRRSWPGSARDGTPRERPPSTPTRARERPPGGALALDALQEAEEWRGRRRARAVRAGRRRASRAGGSRRSAVGARGAPARCRPRLGGGRRDRPGP